MTTGERTIVSVFFIMAFCMGTYAIGHSRAVKERSEFMTEFTIDLAEHFFRHEREEHKCLEIKMKK